MRSLIVLVAIVLYMPSVWGLTSVSRDFNELVSLSDEIIVGTVSDIQSYWRTPELQDTIETNIVLSELEVLKGTVDADQYSVNIAGGYLPPYSVIIPGAPVFKLHQRYVLFIKDNQHAIFPFVGVKDGVFIIDQTPEGGTVMKSLSGAIITAISGATVRKQPASAKTVSGAETMSYEVFRSHVQKRLFSTTTDTQ